MIIMETKICKFIVGVMSKNNKIKNLKVEKLAYSYTGSTQVFDNISFNIETSQTLCILGPNGCGKTTLLNCIVDLLEPNSGQVLIDGQSTKNMTPKKISYNLGYVPQNIIASFDYSVIDYVVCGFAPYLKMFKRPGKKEYELAFNALKSLNIEHLKDKSYAQISGGEQQQVCIARVLTQSPDFILLDEPTSHLDFGNQTKVLELIKKIANKNIGIIMTTHNPDHALLMGGKSLLMKRGENCVFGDTDDVVTQDTLKNLYGINIYLEDSKLAGRKTCVTPPLSRATHNAKYSDKQIDYV